MEGAGTTMAAASAAPAPALLVEPDAATWPRLLRRADDPDVLGRRLSRWHAEVRPGLGLPATRPVIATGHQTLLWHPGILAKYLAVRHVGAAHGLCTANLIVDQHAEGFGSFEAPVRRSDGGLGVRRFHLTAVRAGVPMALHPPFAPDAPPEGWGAPLPSVADGVRRIHAAISRHLDEGDAARQMAAALDDLMAPWVEPAPHVTASALLATVFGHRLLEAMAEDPRACAACYNEAVAATPAAGVTPLRVGREFVELPVWRTRDTGQRVRAYDVDLHRWLDDPDCTRLFPRALLLTALVRLVLCDLFVHGTGGAVYDRAMERWIGGWLGVRPAALAVVSATLRLPFAAPDAPTLASAVTERRRGWHDPESLASASARARPGPEKRALLAGIDRAPRRSAARRRAFAALHHRLGGLRDERAAALAALDERVAQARRRGEQRPVIERRTWPFPLYPTEAIDRLDELVRGAAGGGARGPGPGAQRPD